MPHVAPPHTEPELAARIAAPAPPAIADPVETRWSLRLPLGLALATGLLAVCLAVAPTLIAFANASPAWRIAVQEAAVTSGEKVTLGEIARPLGPMPEAHWKALAATELWPAPPADGKPMAVNRDKLEKALKHYLGENADYCLLPDRLVLRRGGKLLGEDDLAQLVVKNLTPQIKALGREASFRDYRLPESYFMDDPTNELAVDVVGRLEPGRLSLRFVERDLRGQEVRKVSGSVFLDCYKDVMAAAEPLDRDQALTPEAVTTKRVNLAYMRGDPWDGRGGPWRLTRPVGAGEPIYQDDLEPLPMVRRGEAVTLKYEGRHVTLQVMAEALEDAGPGQTVRVRNTQSSREVVARVRDAHTVVVR